MKIDELIAKAQSLEKPGAITPEQVEKAWNDRYMAITSKEEAFYFLCCINLLNAAIKRKVFKKEIYYGGIKKPLSLFLLQLIESEGQYVDDFYLNPEEGPCLYIELNGLQFTFHNVNSKEPVVKEFMESEGNQIKDWKGIRLQWVAGELFEIARERNSSRDEFGV
ncbi:hypothetical protein E7Z59_02720 [Robertkochia marina]|uniref:Uncharacterized protein n=1 Tax=Robertkochia marina TaxID=1227945 RepID=A0A4S3M2B7_9FLAO|nr:hypothetical protein [Robertkochia marina]THD69262.1 hypothetical protein E7Z59_02720 [Robertkochia marina]TRZ47480.1 hypothetical protein D3A96_01880 [Robertkochia marina]